MNTNLAYINEPGKVLAFPGAAPVTESKKYERTNSRYKSDGNPKATAADPIRDLADVQKLLAYFKEMGAPTKTGKPRCVSNRRKYMLFLFGFTCGMRAGDLLNLKVGDVRDKWGRFYDTIELREDKTNKFNSFPITAEMRAELEAQITIVDDDDDYLFPSRQGKGEWNVEGAYTIAAINIMLAKAAAKLGIPGHISSHSMRKTCVYHMLKANTHGREGELTIQYMLNHDDFSTTLRYCGLSRDMLGEMKGAWSAQLAGSL